jgi:transmembrane sensor
MFTPNDGMKMSVLTSASRWLVKLNSNVSTLKDWHDYQLWLDKDPTHRSAIDELQQTQGELKHLARLINNSAVNNRAVNNSAMNNSAINLTPEFVSVVEQQLTEPSITSGGNHRSIAAATIVVLFLVGWLCTTIMLQPGIHKTGSGEQQLIELADGSTIRLNVQSKVRVAYDENQRKVFLDYGEAYFKVAKETQRPFIVDVGNGSIKAVGTAFDIRRRNHPVKIIVTEGIVEVKNHIKSPSSNNNRFKSATNIQRVTKNQVIAIASELSLVSDMSANDINVATAWQRGMLVFDNVPLHKMITELNRFTPGHIQIMNSELREIESGGVFYTKNSESLLDALALVLPVKVVRLTPYLTLLYAKESTK